MILLHWDLGLIWIVAGLEVAPEIPRCARGFYTLKSMLFFPALCLSWTPLGFADSRRSNLLDVPEGSRNLQLISPFQAKEFLICYFLFFWGGWGQGWVQLLRHLVVTPDTAVFPGWGSSLPMCPSPKSSQAEVGRGLEWDARSFRL